MLANFTGIPPLGYVGIYALLAPVAVLALVIVVGALVEAVEWIIKGGRPIARTAVVLAVLGLVGLYCAYVWHLRWI